MLPIVTPEEMAAIDRAAPEPVEVLVGRAGAAVARSALGMLGGDYGRRVVVVAGKGNNGADGRDAAARLRQHGVRVTVVDAAMLGAGSRLPAADLVIDAAYGTGFKGEYAAPDPGRGPDSGPAPVLAVDIPSGVSGLTGEADDHSVRADRTITFAALKPGLVLEPGRSRAGIVEVADIGLDCARARAHLVEASDVAGWLPVRPADAHKWRAAVWVVAGSEGMAGAAVLSARGAQRAGAGYVRLSTPGAPAADPRSPPEAVGHPLQGAAWDTEVMANLDRIRALVVGPGLGRGAPTVAAVRALAAATAVPMVIDGDGLTALAGDGALRLGAPTVLTPHDGEYERLTGHRPGADRFAAARALAASSGAVVLLKGATTVVADTGGEVLVVAAGDARLATAGTGDVLAGIIGALVAQGLDPLWAAATGAWVHGRAGHLGWPRGLVAGDLPDLVPTVFAELEQQ